MAATSRSCSPSGKAPSSDPDVVGRARIQVGESGLSRPGELQQVAPAVGVRGPLRHEPALAELPEDAAQVARVQAEVAAELHRRGSLPMGELEEDAGLGEGEGALEEPLVEQADLAGEEAVELPHGVYPRARARGRPESWPWPSPKVDRVTQ